MSKNRRPIKYYLGSPIREIEGEYQCLRAPDKCCMRCIHTPRFNSCCDSDLLVCDITDTAHKPNDYCLSFVKIQIK